MQELEQAASELARGLAQWQKRIVLAESCTAGLASAALAAAPGISQWHCGSAVTYREQTKITWLGVSARDIAVAGVVSEMVARQMALGVLRCTAEADLGVAITGHLGPDAPPALDGVVFVGAAWQSEDGSVVSRVRQYQLQNSHRVERQKEAACLLLQYASQHLDAW